MSDISKRNAKIVELAVSGLNPRGIADRMPDISMNLIYHTISAARSVGIAIPRFKAVHAGHGGARRVTVAIDPKTLKALSDVAARRGVTASTLANRLLATILADQIIDAVLDDQESAAA